MAKYRSMQGKEVDMDKLMRQNELMPAIGNVKVNARGDELGPGGRIVRKREDIIAEYYENNPKAVPDKVEPIQEKKIVKQPVISEPVQTSRKTKSKDEE
jgi:hypothetical protein